MLQGSGAMPPKWNGIRHMTSVADIARRLHMSPANVYRLLETKLGRGNSPEEPEAIIHPRGGSLLGSSDGAAEKVPSKGGS